MAKKAKLEPGLIDYWDRLTQVDIALLNVAVQTTLKRNNPGALPFLKVETAVQCLDWHVRNIATKKGPFYRVMHKLESWRWSLPKTVQVEGSYILTIEPERLNRLVPIAKRQRVNARKWQAALPFVKGPDGSFTMELATRTARIVYYVTVNPKYLAALRAWLEGVGHLKPYPDRKPHPRSR
jgi:hypothetical protein